MARILTAADGRWYDELRAVAYYGESDLERWILQHARSVFPHHFVIPFKTDIVSQKNAATKRPDLALIRRDFSGWSIVEVEVEGHGLSHVLDQTRVFASGRYNAHEMAEYAQRQLKQSCGKTVSTHRLTGLFSGHTPSVLVIADAPDIGWQPTLEEEHVDFCVFQVYKSVFGRFVYRTSGQYPLVSAEAAHCRRHASMPNVFEVIGNFTFKNLGKTKQVEVEYDELLTRWVVFKDKGKQYLQFTGKSNPLSPSATYGIFRDKSDKYHFRRS